MLEIKNLINDIGKDCDLVIHLGDRAADLSPLLPLTKARIIQVIGNMEIFSPDLEKMFSYDSVFEIEGVKILATHGHLYKVHNDILLLKNAASKIGAALVLFGHTHIQELLTEKGIVFFNPGAFKDGYYGTVIIENGKINKIEPQRQFQKHP